MLVEDCGQVRTCNTLLYEVFYDWAYLRDDRCRIMPRWVLYFF